MSLHLRFFDGGNAVSDFKVQQLLPRLQAVSDKITSLGARFVLAIDKERLSQAPGFDKDNWPDMQDPTWSQEIHAYYGTKPHVDDRL